MIDSLYLSRRATGCLASGIFLRKPEQDGQYCADTHQKWIVQIADNRDRRDGGQPGSHEHLRSIGDDPLNKTREGIQDACGLTAIDSILC